MSRGPILIDLDDTDEARPDAAPAVPDIDNAAMQRIAVVAGRKPSRLSRWFWSLAVALTGFIVSLAAWDYVTGLLDRAPILGWIATLLVGLLMLVVLIIGFRELAAFGRLRKLDVVQTRAREALISNDLKAAHGVLSALDNLYAGRADVAWGKAELAQRKDDMLDADALLALAERSLLAPLDARATREVEAAARQVAMVTAFVPLALADLITALTANLRMIRRIAEIYGGRAGTLGSWRLTRAVLSHLVATGALAVGDDLIGTIAGGGILAKVSRRFGEGIVNGALTARVGVAAMEVCRPLPFHALPRPSVTALVRRALTGLFGTS
ncbi:MULTISPECIES: TIGR01620 family protein [unclassified Yoonia]|uniref:YcjF family protein n=1 Tax=unclassified Yoonia TaxID=2629118 RepID=UPI002AFE9FC4|nr:MULTISPECIES: TIGR01620 family protein [unclassified Yoonia]